ncbi:HEPN domain-containing protein [Escherichia coli]|uniref:HEPN domain-containing protein n=1 Tax=Escherichia coli TaxID=562 RepID=UPI000F68688E|nr:HEPN domain-containing protein [Escherichia coli]RSE16797.1 HEPN domain-containing protein [Escherichia coli]
MELTDTQKIFLNNAAKRSFRDMADQDYLTARICFKNNLPFQFLWMSQQAIEKYIKCILIFNRIPVKNIGHNLIAGIKKINDIPYIKLDLSDKSIYFIEYQNDQGPNRYFQKVMYTNGFEIITLDRTVWELRRYCRLLNYQLKTPKGELIDMLEVELRKIEHSRNVPPHKYKITDGYLEKRLKDNKYNHGNILTWKNLFFGKTKKNTIKIGRSQRISYPTQYIHPESLELFNKFFKTN